MCERNEKKIPQYSLGYFISKNTEKCETLTLEALGYEEYKDM